MGLSRSISNLGRWMGAKPNALVGGRVDGRVESIAPSLVGIKLIQSGVLNVVNDLQVGGTWTVTIPTGVNINKSFLLYTNGSGSEVVTFELTGSTTITATRRLNSGSSSFKGSGPSLSFINAQDLLH